MQQAISLHSPQVRQVWLWLPGNASINNKDRYLFFMFFSALWFPDYWNKASNWQIVALSETLYLWDLHKILWIFEGTDWTDWLSLLSLLCGQQ